MKIIISRKGFDSSNGGCPSPILPDGTLLSMPIPEESDISYRDLYYNNTSYFDIIKDLNPKNNYKTCHLDPDIRKNIRKDNIEGWKPAFGQTDRTQSMLHNAGVDIGDIFLFFGWFHQTTLTENGYRYNKNKMTNFYSHSDLHIIYGYMQVGKIITNPDEIKKFSWHPHASKTHLKNVNNAIYLPSKKLTSLNLDLPGYGVLNYREDRVLTKYGMPKSVWNEYEFLMPKYIYQKRKNSAKNGGLQYSGIWQELIVNESTELLRWTQKIIQ